MKRLMFVLLALLTLSSVCCPAEGKAGLGLSHRQPLAVVYVNKVPPPIPVGRVYNIGDEDLTVTCIWTQKVGVKVLPITVSLLANFVLQPDTSQEVALIMNVVDAAYIGEYYGEVEVVAATKMLAIPGGSKNVPGGTLTANISVTQGSGGHDFPWMWVWIFIGGAIFIFLFLLGISWRRRK